MSPNIESYVSVIQSNNPEDYQIMAMSTLASGAINPKEAYEFIRKHNLQSVVFGASSQGHIQDTIKLLND